MPTQTRPNPWIEKSYHQALKKFADHAKIHDSQKNYQKLAQAMQVQKSYFSQVLHGRAHLNADQLYLGCGYLQLSASETNYLLLLLEFERSAVPERKNALKLQIEKIQSKHLDSSKHISAKKMELSPDAIHEYYLEPLHQIVHISLWIPRYQKSIIALADALGISRERVQNSVSVLERLGWIKFEQGRWCVVVDDIHLPKSSPAYSAWKNQSKLFALQKTQKLTHENDYQFSAVFTADEASRIKIKAQLLEALEKIAPLAKDARAENTFQLSLELFQWT